MPDTKYRALNVLAEVSGLQHFSMSVSISWKFASVEPQSGFYKCVSPGSMNARLT